MAEAGTAAAGTSEADREQAVRAQAKKDAEAHREAVLRAIGRQLDAEAAQRAAAAAASRQTDKPSYAWSTARRARLWGRADPNAELVRYAEALERRIAFNTPFDTVRDVVRHPHADPLVTMAIRRDGSVESITFERSSGSPEIDDAIRRIVQANEHYPPFPPALARDYDVIEVRRTWYFDGAVRLY